MANTSKGKGKYFFTTQHLCGLLNVCPSENTIFFNALVGAVDSIISFYGADDLEKLTGGNFEKDTIATLTRMLNTKGIFKITAKPFGFYILCKDGVCHVNMNLFKKPVTCTCKIAHKFDTSFTYHQLQKTLSTKSAAILKVVKQVKSNYTYSKGFSADDSLKIQGMFAQATQIPNIYKLGVKPLGFYVACRDLAYVGTAYRPLIYYVRINANNTVTCTAQKI